MFFHVKHKGNENVKGLTNGQRVSYTEMSNDKGVCAGNVKPIEGVCVCVCVHVFSSRNGDRKSESARVPPHTQALVHDMVKPLIIDFPKSKQTFCAGLLAVEHEWHREVRHQLIRIKVCVCVCAFLCLQGGTGIESQRARGFKEERG